MEYKPLEGRKFPRFSGIKTFFRLPIAQANDDFDVALFGVPFDGGASYRVGQRFAPQAVRGVSSLGRGYHWNRDINIFDSLKVADVGDSPTVPIDLKQTYERVERFALELLKNKKRFVACGGDHSITLPLLRAAKKSVKKPLGLIHFDAHFDTYPPAWDCEYHHGTFARHAVEENLVDPELMIQIGVRGPLATKDDTDFTKKHGIKVWTVGQIKEKGIPALLKDIPEFKKTPVYLSFDVDCLDPAFAPGTGTPVVGGLCSFEVQKILRGLPKINLVGADVVEIIPAYDPSEITQLLAVDVIFEALALMAREART